MNTVFFIASKLIGALLRPDTWIIIALAIVVLALLTQRRRLALWISGLTLVTLVTLAILPLGNLLLQPIERSYPANPPLSQVDGIIVLGGGEDAWASAYWGQMQFNEGGDRFAAGISLARQFPYAQLLFTGGSGALRDIAGVAVSEASIAERFFLDQGIDPDRLLLEGRSRNTAENAGLSLALADPGADETWVLVTSAFHMPRAMRSFEAAGWSGIVAWPVDYRTSRFVDGISWDLTHNLQVLNTAIREQVGQLAYRLTGR
jgi:uncharacterized SAM-binding protein YcdF (DUF218 family)